MVNELVPKRSQQREELKGASRIRSWQLKVRATHALWRTVGCYSLRWRLQQKGAFACLDPKAAVRDCTSLSCLTWVVYKSVGKCHKIVPIQNSMSISEVPLLSRILMVSHMDPQRTPGEGQGTAGFQSACRCRHLGARSHTCSAMGTCLNRAQKAMMLRHFNAR